MKTLLTMFVLMVALQFGVGQRTVTAIKCGKLIDAHTHIMLQGDITSVS